MAVALAFGAAVAWGIADFLGAVTSRRLSVMLVLAAQQVAGLVLVLVLLVVAGGEISGVGTVAIALVSGALQTIGMAAYYRALSTGTMGVVAPISATAAVVPLVVGLATGDDPSGHQAAGMLLAVGGVAAAAYQPVPGQLDKRRTAVGAGLALVAAFCLGAFFVLLDVAGDRADLTWVVLINRFGAIVTLGLVAVAMRERLRAEVPAGAWRRSDPLLIIAIGWLASGATFLFAAATTHGLISVVSVIGALYPVTTVLMARAFLRERMRPLQRAGAATALAGVALISL